MVDKYENLTSIHFAIILATFEVAQLITCLILGKRMPIKRKNWMLYAFTAELIATLSFSLFDYLGPDQSMIFFFGSVCLRAL
jgi:uroporphyrinogen-III decarboxylase